MAEESSEEKQNEEETAEDSSFEERGRIRRAPAIPTAINKLSKDSKRVSIVGTIVSRNEDIYSLVVDDGTGSVVVILNDMNLFEQLKDGQFVRVFGRVMGEGEELEIIGDIVQDFSKIDKEMYKKVFSS